MATLVTDKAQADENTMKLAAQIMEELWSFCIEQRKEAKGDAELFQRLQMGAVIQIGAVLAVDLGADLEQFDRVCQINWKDAYGRAPKWG